MSRFRAVQNGIEATLLEAEIAILIRLGGMLAAVGLDKNDPAKERLNPTVYPGDKDATRDFHRLADKEKIEARSADREVFGRTLEAAAEGSVLLNAEESGAWARVLGETRVVLSARKGLFESGLPEGRVDDPEVALVMFLGVVQEELVSEMLKNMEDGQ